MSQHLNYAKSLQAAIHKMLIEEWDPIGVGGIPEAQDEYNAYIPTIYKMLITRQSKNDIVSYLWWVEAEHMGLNGDRQHTEAFADNLVALATHA